MIFFTKCLLCNLHRGGGRDKPVCIDCGAHAGLVTDIIVHCGGICHSFEPNIYLFPILSHKYSDNPYVILYPKAVSNANGSAQFLQDSYGVFSQGNSIIASARETKTSYTVEVVDISEILSQLIAKHKRLYLLKLDVEGAEFDIMEKIIDKKLHLYIDYIVCETHERFFTDGSAKIARLRSRIAQENADNIFIDWI